MHAGVNMHVRAHKHACTCAHAHTMHMRTHTNIIHCKHGARNVNVYKHPLARAHTLRHAYTHAHSHALTHTHAQVSMRTPAHLQAHMHMARTGMQSCMHALNHRCSTVRVLSEVDVVCCGGCGVVVVVQSLLYGVMPYVVLGCCIACGLLW